MLNRRRTFASRGIQRGLSLVELMVGITVGLIVVAAASLMMTNQVIEHSRLMRETQLQQDLRAVGDLMLRDIRRAGFWATAELGVWSPGQTPTTNFYANFSAPAATQQALYAYSMSDDYTLLPKDPPQVPSNPQGPARKSNEGFGFQLSEGGVLQSLLGGGAFTVVGNGIFQYQSGTWQPLTDPTALVIDEFTITQVPQTVSLGDYCTKACLSTDANCPAQIVRRFDIHLKAHSSQDTKVVRTLNISSRVRNDQIIGSCPAT